MKLFRRVVLFALLVGGGAFIWHAYDVGWLHSPLANPGTPLPKTVAAVGAGATDSRPRGEAADSQEGGGRRGRGGSSGRRGGGEGGLIPVLTVAARYQDVPVTLEAVGTIQALNTVTARTQVDGRLVGLGFKDGQDVKQGDVLARIDPTTYQAILDQSVAKKAQDEALLSNAKIDLTRYVKLASSDFGPKQQADTQKSLVAQYEAQIKGDQATIDNNKAIFAYTTIKSPIGGRTGIRLVDVGNILHAADTTGIVTITQMQPIAMIFNLPQQNLTAINAALAKGSVKVEALQADNATVLDRGAIDVVDNQVDQSTGTIKIKAQFPNTDRHLWPGEFVNVRVYVSTLPHVVVVPSAAVQRGPNGAYCFVLGDKSTVKQTDIEVGQQDESIAVVKKGVEPPQQIVTTGFARLTDGAKVSVPIADNSAPADAKGDGGQGAERNRTPSAGDAALAPSNAATPPSQSAPTGAPPGEGRRGGRHRRQRGNSAGEGTPASGTP